MPPKQPQRRVEEEEEEFAFEEDVDQMLMAPVVRRGAQPGRMNQRRDVLQMDAARQPVGGRARYANGRIIRARTWIAVVRGRQNQVLLREHLIGQPVPGSRATLSYMCGQVELGQTPGQQHAGFHWQGYLEFSDNVSAFEIMNFFGWNPGEVHLEPRFGSQQDAIDYTRKETTQVAELDDHLPREQQDPQSWKEAGQPHPPNVAAAWQHMRQVVMNGAGMMDMLQGDIHQFRLLVQYNSGIRNLIQAVENDDGDELRDVKVIVYYGEPRSGKSGTVYRRHAFKEIFKRGQAAAQHYTGYNKQKVLLIDDLPLGQADCPMSIGDLQNALDPYPMSLNAKHTQHRARWDTVYICTNLPPSLWFPRADRVVHQSILERISEMWKFTKTEVILEKGPGDFPPIPDPKLPNQPRIVRVPDPVPVPAAPAQVQAPQEPHGPAPPVEENALSRAICDKMDELIRRFPEKSFHSLVDHQEVKRLFNRY